MTWEPLLYNLAQIGLTVSLASLLPILLRRVLKKRYPARAMCVVWAVLAVRLLAPVQLTLPEPPVQVTPRISASDTMPTQGGAVHTAASPAALTAQPVQAAGGGAGKQAASVPAVRPVSAGALLAAVWLAGALGFALWQAAGYLAFRRRLRRSMRPAERDTLRAAFAAEKRSLGVTRPLPLRISGAADCPMLVGFLRPALYLPDETPDNSEASFIFRHELTHYKRGDLWLKLLLTAARAVHWFNPLVHLMARFAQEDIELACDDAVSRGMDGAARRAYGEAILRSAAAQSRRRALISCFAGDKRTLMRRFEGLYDRTAKKRGIALVLAVTVLVAGFGCTISVGAAGMARGEILAAAEVYARAVVEANGKIPDGVTLSGQQERFAVWEYGRYALQYEPESETCLAVFEMRFNAGRARPAGYDAERISGYPYREVQRLSFQKANGAAVASGAEVLFHPDNGDAVDSLADFRLLYENSLGLPDGMDADIDWMSYTDDPAGVAAGLLRLSGGAAEDISYHGVNYLGQTLHEGDFAALRYAFADGSAVCVTLSGGMGGIYLPQDWTDGDGANARTPADLAAQAARAVGHKNGQELFPVLSEEMQMRFLSGRYIDPDSPEEWGWKIVGSSPTCSAWALAPGRAENQYIAVFQLYGGGASDARAALTVTVGQEGGRSVVTGLDECAGLDYTQSELFELYYNTGLPWPDETYLNHGDSGVADFNGTPVSEMDSADAAVRAALGYPVMDPVGLDLAVPDTVDHRAFAVTRVSAEQPPLADIEFSDGSTVCVGLARQESGAYLPCCLMRGLDGLTVHFAQGGNTAPLAVYDGSGQASAFCPTERELEAGGTLVFRLAHAPDNGKLTVTDALVREDGTLEFDARAAEVTVELTVRGGQASYAVESHPAVLLRSTYPMDGQRRRLTLAYTADGAAYTGVTGFRLPDGGAGGRSTTLDGQVFTNRTFGYELTLPDCFDERVYAAEEGDTVRFGLRYAMGGSAADETAAGIVMTLCMEPTAVLVYQFGEDWQTAGPAPVKQIAQRNGMSYYLRYASDVQYNADDRDITAAWQELDAAAHAMTGDSFRFLSGDADDLLAWQSCERERLLAGLAGHYVSALAEREDGRPVGYEVRGYYAEPDADNRNVRVTYSVFNQSDAYERRAAVRLFYDADTALDPARVENLGSSDQKGTTLEKFLLYYFNDLALPVFDADSIYNLQVRQSQGIVDLSTPENGARYAAALSEAYGAFDGRPEYGADGETCRVVFRFWNPDKPWEKKPEGGRVELQMRLVQMAGSLPGVWLPEDFTAFDASGAEQGSLYLTESPYDKVYAQAMAYYRDRTTDELTGYLNRGLTDGAYTEGVLYELARRQNGGEDISAAAGRAGEPALSLWKAYQASAGETRVFSTREIEDACQAVRDYAAAHDFSVENLHYDGQTDRDRSLGILRDGVLQDNAANGLALDDVITVVGDAKFGDPPADEPSARGPVFHPVYGQWSGSAPGWSFTLYRENGTWILEDGAFGY